ncbi:putative molybdenum transport ATP-binding protein modF [Lentisphaera araneosa HTCC2155]|uniref:Putative molybdenum transport ATP-binding protein modF n=1 Tax=Lentisphaera araneosa HTCC2155 TaxID=313628 RepID=A6DKR8_9BACT|nr:ATP-binding cassette domain-containing protein [Lentisphaera araneosa]EDM27966.1 putative molybdenum transport ATP-binding protein modF [Lentisphaera araneosa HTCC2155]
MTNIKSCLIKLENAQLVLRQKRLLENFSWELKTHEHWTIIGPNGSGKSLLVGLLTQRYQGKEIEFFINPEKIQEVSFSAVQESLDYEAWNDDSEFIEGGFDKGRSVKEFICEDRYELDQDLITQFKLDNFLETGIKFISNGEMRKAHILRALVRNPQILILDGIFEGLDKKAKVQIGAIINALPGSTQIINCVQDSDQIPEKCTHLLCLDKCQIMSSGPRSRVESSREFERLFKEPPPIPTTLPDSYTSPEIIEKGTEIIRMKDLSVVYGEKTVINQLTWSVNAGEHWCISGPNGAGKTTLLSLISADNPQGYGKDFYLFGRKRGSGESIWDIKKRIGIVTTELQLEYHQNIFALDVVVSGFFDSIGLYREADASHLQIARDWMQTLGLKDLEDISFENLSYGERRSVLLARAMVKSPNILILDEPCQGLDKRNRTALMNTVSFLAKETDMTILYVSHKAEAQLDFIKYHLEFVAEDGQPCSFAISSE